MKEQKRQRSRISIIQQVRQSKLDLRGADDPSTVSSQPDSITCRGFRQRKHLLLRLPLLVACTLYVLCTHQKFPDLIGVIRRSIPFGSGTKDPWDMVPDDAVQLPLNLNSTMYEDIVGIYHVPSTSSIMVVITDHGSGSAAPLNQTQGRSACLRPYLIGRLSGPALGTVGLPWVYTHWNMTKGSSSRRQQPSAAEASADGGSDSLLVVHSSVVEGRYNVPFAGEYYIEIIVLLCNKWGEENPLRHSDDIELIRQNCVENPMRHRLTAENTTIRVVAPQPSASTQHTASSPPDLFVSERDERSSPGEKAGYWIHDETGKIGPALNESILSRTRPLYTRFQPSNCTGDWCHEAESMTRYSPYHFRWNQNAPWYNNGSATSLAAIAVGMSGISNDESAERNLTSRVQAVDRSAEVICLFGASHSRVLARFMRPFIPSATVVHINVQFARDLAYTFDNESDSRIVAQRHADRNSQPKIAGRGCSISLVGIGQWDAGWKDDQPTPVLPYERDLHRTVRHIEWTYPASKIFLWNIHYAPLGNRMWDRCPSGEWRHPAFIDEYNAALQRIANNSSDPARPEAPRRIYLDTSFITGPEWDSAEDWYHYKNEVGKQEALYLIAAVLGIMP
jgi:hypothetical protein